MGIISAESGIATTGNLFILTFNELLMSANPFPVENLDCMAPFDGVSLAGIEP